MIIQVPMTMREINDLTKFERETWRMAIMPGDIAGEGAGKAL
jgi:hypothetical protein